MKYRKKPVVIEAVRFGGSTTDAVAVKHWMEGNEYRPPTIRTSDLRSLTIDTLEGAMEARPGDWIIRGVQGEFYPCKPAIFDATYEPVEEEHDDITTEELLEPEEWEIDLAQKWLKDKGVQIWPSVSCDTNDPKETRAVALWFLEQVGDFLKYSGW